MDDFLESLGKKFTETVDDLSKKAGDTLEVQKLKSQIRSLERANERDYIEIGKQVYEKFKEGQVSDLEHAAYCEEIEKREEQIADTEKQISRIKGE